MPAKRAQGRERRTSRGADGRARGRTAWPNGARRPSASRRFRDAADVAIYTPGAETGLPLSVLRSFAAPPPELLSDTARAARSRSARSSRACSALLGSDADPIKSREHILLANILEHAWRDGHEPRHGRR